MRFQNLEKYEKQFFWIFFILLLWPFSNSLGNSNDFDIFLKAARRIHYGFSMYATSVDRGLYFYYSPFFALLISPFTYLPDIVFSADSMLPNIHLQVLIGKIVWNSIQVFLSFKIASYALEEFKETQNRKWFLIILMFLLYRWFHLNIKYGQFTTILLWSIWYSFRNYSKYRFFQLLPLSFGINVKIIPAFIGLYWLIYKDLKSIIYTFIWVIILIIIPLILMSTPYNYEQFHDWVKIINPFNKAHILEIGEGGFIDIGSLITKYSISIKIPTEPTVCLMKLTVSQIFWVTQICRILILAAVIYIALKLKDSKIEHAQFMNLGMLLTAIPLFFPHQRDYSLAFFIPSVIYVVFSFLNHRNYFNKGLLVTLFLGLLFMGCIVFYEFLSLQFRYWMLGVRLQGIGGILFFVGNFLFLKRVIYIDSRTAN